MRVGSMKLIRVSSMVFMAVACAAAAFAQTNTSYGGEATALSGMVAGVPLNLAGTGALDPSGGARNNSLVCYPGGPQCYVGVPDQTSGLLSVQVLNAVSVGQGKRTSSHAAVAKLSMVINGVALKADYVAGIAESVWQEDPAAEFVSHSIGRAEFSQLTIAGTPIAVSGTPNQTITVPSPLGGTITIVMNEQTVSNGYLTVRALHIKAPNILGVVDATDVSIGKADAKVNCGNVEKCLNTKVTGGGFVVLPTGKLTFAASGRNASPWGHFVAVNHETGDKLQATMQMTAIAGDTAVITGEAQINGDGLPHPFVATLVDNGEPGRNNDLFTLVVDNVELVSAMPLGGGNIQVHGLPKSCDGVVNPPGE
jgi:hypothetical protein